MMNQAARIGELESAVDVLEEVQEAIAEDYIGAKDLPIGLADRIGIALAKAKARKEAAR